MTYRVMSYSAVHTISRPLHRPESKPPWGIVLPVAKPRRNPSSNVSEIAELSRNLSRGEWTPTYNFVVKSALGSWVQDIEGHWYLDFLSSASSVALGYCNPALIEAATSALTNLSQACTFYTPHAYLNDFIRTVFRHTPGSFEKSILFGLSGSDAIEGAMKAASRYRKSSKFIAFENSYHGGRSLSRALTGFPGLPGGNGAQVEFLPFPSTDADATEVLSRFLELAKTEIYAAVCIEPIQGDAGNRLPPDGFLAKLGHYSGITGIPVIADEIQTGIGRTGRFWACEHFGLVPDILVAGKAVTGGYFPMSYSVGRREILQALEPAEHVFTYSAHPAACAVALRVMQIIEDDRVLINVQRRGSQLSIGLSAIQTEFRSQFKISIRGIGLQMAFEVEDEAGSLSTAVISIALRSGLLLGLFGSANQTIRLHPPLVITHDEVNQALDIIHRAIRTLSLVNAAGRRNFISETQFHGGLSTSNSEGKL